LNTLTLQCQFFLNHLNQFVMKILKILTTCCLLLALTLTLLSNKSKSSTTVSKEKFVNFEKLHVGTKKPLATQCDDDKGNFVGYGSSCSFGKSECCTPNPCNGAN
jgi:hypothetical protein